MARKRKEELPLAGEVFRDRSILDTLNESQLLVLWEELKGKAAALGVAGVVDNPADFAAKYSDGAWLHAPHLDYLSREIATSIRTGTHLLVSMPPRHGKSQLVSIWTPLWFLSQDPHRRVILVSYEATFAAEWGLYVRNKILELTDTLKLRLDRDRTARDDWALTTGGGMQTAGAGGPVTGKGAQLLVIDDPIKNDEEASSLAHREKLWRWWETTAFTRLEPRGVAIVVGTRWHEDDLIGRLENRSNADGTAFRVVNLPALAEKNDPLGRTEGDPLWPERWPSGLKWYQDKKRGMSIYNWSALYQGRPSPEGGGTIKRSWWRPFGPADCPDEFDDMLQSWDLAAKTGVENDWTVGQVWARKGPNCYILASVRGRYEIGETMSYMRVLSNKFPRAVLKLIEAKVTGYALIQSLRQHVQGVVEADNRPSGGGVEVSKQRRVEAVAPLFQSGCVFYPTDANGVASPWVHELIDEVANFPKGTYDDQVDAATQALLRFMPAGWHALSEAQKEALGMNEPPALDAAAERFHNKRKQSIADFDEDLEMRELDAEDLMYDMLYGEQ